MSSKRKKVLIIFAIILPVVICVLLLSLALYAIHMTEKLLSDTQNAKSGKSRETPKKIVTGTV